MKASQKRFEQDVRRAWELWTAPRTQSWSALLAFGAITPSQPATMASLARQDWLVGSPFKSYLCRHVRRACRITRLLECRELESVPSTVQRAIESTRARRIHLSSRKVPSGYFRPTPRNRGSPPTRPRHLPSLATARRHRSAKSLWPRQPSRCRSARPTRHMHRNCPPLRTQRLQEKPCSRGELR